MGEDRDGGHGDGAEVRPDEREHGGPPDLAVEIVSPNEGDGLPWADKVARYHELGIKELVRFDPDAPEGLGLRVWDAVHGDLVERVIGADRTR